MKEGWTYKKLGEVCEVISGQSPEGKYYNTERKGIPFYQGKKDFSLKYIGEPTMWTTDVTKIAEKDDLLMSVRAPVGDVNFATQRLCIGRGLAAIRTKGKVDKEYLFYFLLAKKNNIKGKEGVGFASINRKEIMDIDIHYPDDLSEQLSIVARLDAAFADIDALKANAGKQLSEARQLFQAELSECMKPKEGWEEKRLRDVIDSLRTGLNPRVHFKLNTSDAKGYYITVRELKGFSFEVDNKTDRINEAAIKRINERSNLEIGDVLYSGTGTIGRTAIVRELPTWWGIKEGVYAITPKKAAIDSYFMVYTMHSDSFNRKVMSKTSGTTVRSIPMKELKEITIPVPTLDDQHRIVSHLDSLSAKVRELEEVERKTLAECDALKQAMLREVFE